MRHKYFLTKIKEAIETNLKLDGYTLNIIFNYYTQSLQTTQRKQFNYQINHIETIIQTEKTIAKSIYQMNINDLENVLSEFKVNLQLKEY